MNFENFAYWLQGYLEIAGTEKGITPEQAQVIQDHLNLVFNKVTPDRTKKISPLEPVVSEPLASYLKVMDEERARKISPFRCSSSPQDISEGVSNTRFC